MTTFAVLVPLAFSVIGVVGAYRRAAKRAARSSRGTVAQTQACSTPRPRFGLERLVTRVRSGHHQRPLLGLHDPAADLIGVVRSGSPNYFEMAGTVLAVASLVPLMRFGLVASRRTLVSSFRGIFTALWRATWGVSATRRSTKKRDRLTSPTSYNDAAGKLMLVTGAGRACGRAIAEDFARRGATGGRGE